MPAAAISCYTIHMKISIASDHAGFELKAFLVAALEERGHEVHDHGAHEFSPDDDFPIYIAKVAEEISKHEESIFNGARTSHTVHGEPRSHHPHDRDMVGIVIGGSGQGEAMAANKFPHVRAAVVYGGRAAGGSAQLIETIAKLSRQHNDSNVLSFGARFIDPEEALKVAEIWLATPFLADPKYERRNDEIEEL